MQVGISTVLETMFVECNEYQACATPDRNLSIRETEHINLSTETSDGS